MDTQVAAAPTWISELENEAQQTLPAYEVRRRIWGSTCFVGVCDKHSTQVYTFPDSSEARGEVVEVCDNHRTALESYFTDQEVLAWFDYDTGAVQSRYNRTNELVRQFLGQ